MITLSDLPFSTGVIARTLVEDDGKFYEVISINSEEGLDPETAAFWHEFLKDHPYETTVYKLVDKEKPMSAIEAKLCELLPVNDRFRRDLELGDLYVSRSADMDSAALEHDNVIEEFKSGSILLLTIEERNAIYGPGKCL